MHATAKSVRELVNSRDDKTPDTPRILSRHTRESEKLPNGSGSVISSVRNGPEIRESHVKDVLQLTYRKLTGPNIGFVTILKNQSHYN